MVAILDSGEFVASKAALVHVQCEPGNDSAFCFCIRLCAVIVLAIARSAVHDSVKGEVAMSMYIGEALVGEGNEVAHIDLLIGSKDGPVGIAFAGALADQKQGFSNLLAVLE